MFFKWAYHIPLWRHLLCAPANWCSLMWRHLGLNVTSSSLLNGLYWETFIQIYRPIASFIICRLDWRRRRRRHASLNSIRRRRRKRNKLKDAKFHFYLVRVCHLYLLLLLLRLESSSAFSILVFELLIYSVQNSEFFWRKYQILSFSSILSFDLLLYYILRFAQFWAKFWSF